MMRSALFCELLRSEVVAKRTQKITAIRYVTTQQSVVLIFFASET